MKGEIESKIEIEKVGSWWQDGFEYNAISILFLRMYLEHKIDDKSNHGL